MASSEGVSITPGMEAPMITGDMEDSHRVPSSVMTSDGLSKLTPASKNELSKLIHAAFLHCTL